MSDAETIAAMKPEQLALAMGGKLFGATESACDCCEAPPERTCQIHWLIHFRAQEVTHSSILCLACLQAETLIHLKRQAQADRAVEEEETDATQRVPTPFEWEGCGS